MEHIPWSKGNIIFKEHLDRNQWHTQGRSEEIPPHPRKVKRKGKREKKEGKKKKKGEKGRNRKRK